MAELWSEPIQSSALHFAHGFLTGPQSDREAYEIAGTAPALVWLTQVHSADALCVTKPFPEEARPKADAMVTAERGLCLAIVTADCAPVLLEDKQAGVIGAAHAGWRGAHSGVLEAAIAAMVKLGAKPERIAAAIGPCIAQASYEVDSAFRDAFTSADAGFFADGKPGHFQFDLEAYARSRLHKAGVGHVDCLSIDTYAHERHFYSYRRATHRGVSTHGRQVSLIALA